MRDGECEMVNATMSNDSKVSEGCIQYIERTGRNTNIDTAKW
jgi:hypothetical protein